MAASLTSSLRILCLIGAIMCSLSIARASDKWAYFYPETVKSYGCRIYNAEIVMHGQMRGEMAWEAVGFAERVNDHWTFEVGRFEYTPKGRHKAEKACSKWQDEAERRLRGVHK